MSTDIVMAEYALFDTQPDRKIWGGVFITFNVLFSQKKEFWKFLGNCFVNKNM